jgi:hypothetical protein
VFSEGRKMTCIKCKHGYLSTYDLKREGWVFCGKKDCKWYINRYPKRMIYVKRDFECEDYEEEK